MDFTNKKEFLLFKEVKKSEGTSSNQMDIESLGIESPAKSEKLTLRDLSLTISNRTYLQSLMSNLNSLWNPDGND